jgi:oxygen-independent coproporphyrinogen-3 oxidase
VEWENLQKNLLDALLNELDLRLDELSPDAIETVFIGGGTPSSIKPDLLDHFFIGLEKRLRGMISLNTEFSIEANPESCTQGFLSVLKSHKVNRLSLGVQSFDTKTLQTIGRASFPDDVFGTVENIRSSWKRRLSLDLITGVNYNYMDDITRALSLSPEHLSVYALTFEENTPLYDDLINNRITPPDDELQAEAITAAWDYLEQNGFKRYEISNYARTEPDSVNECAHNIAYWNMQSYVGIGPGAVSSFYSENKKTRITNTENIENYIQCFQENKTSVETCRSIEVLNHFDFILEHYLMGGRLKKGIDKNVFTSRFGHPPEYYIPETISAWRAAGLTGIGSCALNDDGMLLLNRFISEIYDELKKNNLF